MEKRVWIPGSAYDIPGVLCSDTFQEKRPAMILCHGTGSQKDEVGDLFKKLAAALCERKIASLRFDFAGCGESRASGRELTFLGEVEDTDRVYRYLRSLKWIDTEKMGILGFSQGARVMAWFLKENPGMKLAVSWSGACQEGRGSFEEWFRDYYREAEEKGWASIPLGWREDLILSKQWFDEIQKTRPLEGIETYQGPVLVLAGEEDETVPKSHAEEIYSACRNSQSRLCVLPGADHIFNVLSGNTELAEQVIRQTADWVLEKMRGGKFIEE